MAIFKVTKEELGKRKKELNKLNENDLENVTGGYIYNVSGEGYEVISDYTGEVLESGLKSYIAAVTAAQTFNMSTEEIDWSTLDNLRKNH